MRRRLDMDRIGEALGAERRGRVRATSGYYGALQLVADIDARFRSPRGGGRATEPRWTERRLVPLAPKTLRRLEKIAAKVRRLGTNVEPLQLAALLLEKTVENLDAANARKLLRRSG